jgi:3'(2'), 5'-bisphosphate nucleotidase
VWIVDPLDGTRDFVQRTDDFAVHVALAVEGEPVVGAVYLPVTGTLFCAARGGGAWREVDGRRERIQVSATSELRAVRLGVSRHHLSDRLRDCLDTAQIASRSPIGASVKHMRVAAGELEAVINLSKGELEWDTCAPEIVIREAGGSYTDAAGKPFRYNQRDLEHHLGSVASNGACHAELIAMLAPHLIHVP